MNTDLPRSRALGTFAPEIQSSHPIVEWHGGNLTFVAVPCLVTRAQLADQRGHGGRSRVEPGGNVHGRVELGTSCETGL